MSIKMRTKGTKISEKAIQSFEESIDSRLPEGYRTFLFEHNGGKPETNKFTIPDENMSSGINTFLPLDEMQRQKELLGNRLVDAAWPIAYAEGGNLVCLMAREQHGAIYFWDHELEAESRERPSWKNMFLLSSNFHEFWNALEPSTPNQVTLQPGQVKRAWIDPKLLEELKSHS